MEPASTNLAVHAGTIDITTTGRRTGVPRRITIVTRVIDGRLFITGRPQPGRPRAWLLNLTSDRNLTLHPNGIAAADLSATARIVTDEAERRAVLGHIVRVWRGLDLESMVEHSPLIEVSLDRPTG